ncbi:MAG TPA: flagellar filament capping protein FliD, partial [Clostridiales bacterium]|nr:flagellar filament capping protein FliD [Clostridiales bacterium]
MDTGINLLTSKFRIGGLATGFDTDKMVSDLMKIERMPLDKLCQKKQLAEWKRDGYRDITNLLRSLKDEFFDILKPSNYLLSQSTYKKLSATSSDSSMLTATASAQAMTGIYNIEVKKLATADQIESSDLVTVPVKSNAPLTLEGVKNASGKNIVVVLDGISKEITLGDFTGAETLENALSQLADDLESKINSAFGTGKVNISIDGDYLTLTTTGGSSKLTLTNGYSNDGLSLLNITPGSSNRLNMYQTLESLSKSGSTDLKFNDEGNLEFEINSKKFTFSKTTTLANMLSTINSDEDAKVTITYDEITDKFVIKSRALGAGNNITISQTGGNFFGSADPSDSFSKISIEPDRIGNGKDAVIVINNTTVTRSSNNFTLNGITYNLHKADEGKTHTITVSTDVDGVYDSIKGFVDKYNEIIDIINGKLAEKYEREYQPLTNEQKEALSEKETERWEKRAKTGLLKNDSILESIVINMRRALFDKIEGVDINVTSIGITTGRYEEKGKLKIDEQKLKTAIRENPD